MKRITTLLIMTCFCMMCSQTVSAHEFANPLRWNHVNNAYRVTKVDRLYLASGSFYQNNFEDALQVWMESPTKAYCIEETFTNSNVSMFTPTQSYWNSFNLPSGVLALTILSDTNSYSFYTYNGSSNSNGLIDYGRIMVNPDNNSNSLNENAQMSIVIHEIGHVFGLWHCSQSTNSIMKPLMYNGFPTSIKPHDINDMNSFYQ